MDSHGRFDHTTDRVGANGKILHPIKTKATCSLNINAEPTIVHAEGTDFVLQTLPNKASLSTLRPGRTSYSPTQSDGQMRVLHTEPGLTSDVGHTSSAESFTRSRVTPSLSFDSDDDHLAQSATYAAASSSVLPSIQRQPNQDLSSQSIEADWDQELGIKRPSSSLLLSATIPSAGSDRTIYSAPVQTPDLSNIQGLRVTCSTSENWDDDYVFHDDTDGSRDARSATAESSSSSSSSFSNARMPSPDDEEFDDWDASFSWSADMQDQSSSRVPVPPLPTVDPLPWRPSFCSSRSDGTSISARLAAQADTSSWRDRSSCDHGFPANTKVGLHATILPDCRVRKESSSDDTETDIAASASKLSAKSSGRRSLGQALGFAPRRPVSSRLNTAPELTDVQPTEGRGKRNTLHRFSLSRSRSSVVFSSDSLDDTNSDRETGLYPSAGRKSQSSAFSGSSSDFRSTHDFSSTSLVRTFSGASKKKSRKSSSKMQRRSLSNAVPSVPTSLPPEAFANTMRPDQRLQNNKIAIDARRTAPSVWSTRSSRAMSETEPSTKSKGSLSSAFGINRSSWRNMANKSQTDITALQRVSGLAELAEVQVDQSAARHTPLHRDFPSSQTLRAEVVPSLATKGSTMKAGKTASLTGDRRSVSASTASSVESSELGFKLLHTSGCDTNDSDATYSTSVGSSTPGGYFPYNLPSNKVNQLHCAKQQLSNEGQTQKRDAGGASHDFDASPATLADDSAVWPPETAKVSRPLTGADTRRNSPSDLKIPSRISNAQHGLRNNMNLVREFAKGIEELKMLKAQYTRQQPNSSAALEEAVENWLECADVLIGLGAGRSESDTRPDPTWRTSLIRASTVRSGTCSETSSYLDSSSDTFTTFLSIAGNRNVSGTSDASVSTTTSSRSVDVQREIDILSAILGGTRSSIGDLSMSMATQQIASQSLSTASLSHTDEIAYQSGSSELACASLSGVVDGTGSSRRRLRSASRAGLLGLRELIKGFWSPSKDANDATGADASIQYIRRLSTEKSMQEVNEQNLGPTRSKRKSLNLKRRSLVRLRDAEARVEGAPHVETNVVPPLPSSPVPLPTDGALVSPVSSPRALLDSTNLQRHAPTLQTRKHDRSDSHAGSLGRTTTTMMTPTRQTRDLSRGNNGKYTSGDFMLAETGSQSRTGRRHIQGNLSRNSVQHRSRDAFAGIKGDAPMSSTTEWEHPGTMEKLALRAETLPKLLVYVQATKQQLTAAIDRGRAQV